MYTVEDGIPLPSANTAKKEDYPVETLEIGQSFFVPNREGEVAAPSSLHTAIYRTKLRTGRHFATRRVEGGTRVWRVA